MAKVWRIFPHDSARIAALQQQARVPPVIAQLLLSRGIHEASHAGEFLECKLTGLRDPELLPGLPNAADRIHAAVQAKRKIVVYGDYDADGMTAAAILYRCLKLLGAEVETFVPSRLDEGYGLHGDALRRLADRGASLVVTVDCGIASVAEADVARELNLELIITDHHEPGSELPRAAAIVHPRLPGHHYPFDGLCGAGVALKVAWAICQRHCGAKKVTQNLREFLLQAVGLAALGTVADVVPLLDENRVLVRHGLSMLKERPVPGLAALYPLAKVSSKEAFASEDLAFSLAPRLNAAGRLGQAALGVELLTTDLLERANALAEHVHRLNSDRDSLERKVLRAATEQIEEHFDPVNDPALVLAGRGWHPGVIGIVAGRIAEKHHRPTIVISLDEFGGKPGVGSGRSACGLNLHHALAACRDHLVSCGGHAAAAGLKVEEDRVDTFRAAFCEHVSAEVAPADRIAEIQIDAETALGHLTLQTVEAMERLSPFGQCNPRPVLCVSGVMLAEPPKKMGEGERHLAVTLHHQGKRIRGIAFGKAEWADELAKAGPLDIAFRPVINEFRGYKNVEIHLVDWRPSMVAAAVTS